MSDTEYNLFYAIEEEVRQHLVVTAANTFTEGTREVILTAVMCSEDVLLCIRRLLNSNLKRA